MCHHFMRSKVSDLTVSVSQGEKQPTRSTFGSTRGRPPSFLSKEKIDNMI